MKKKCSKCGKIKPTKMFCKSSRYKDGFQVWCKECMTKNTMKRYRKDKKKFNQRNNQYKRKRLLKVYEYLKDKCCVDCGESRTVVLEFDHVNSEDKFMNISKLYGWSWNAIEREIAKCEIVCANCHKVRTAKRNGWEKLNF